MALKTKSILDHADGARRKPGAARPKPNARSVEPPASAGEAKVELPGSPVGRNDSYVETPPRPQAGPARMSAEVELPALRHSEAKTKQMLRRLC